MPKYKAQVIITVWKDVVIEADNLERAKEKMRARLYEDERVVEEEYDQSTYGPWEIKTNPQNTIGVKASS